MKPILTMLSALTLLCHSAAFAQTSSTRTHLSIDSIESILTAEMLLNRQHPTAALRYYAKALQDTPSASIAQRVTELAIQHNRATLALNAAEQWAQLSPDNIQAQATLTALSLSLNQTRWAQKALLNIQRHAPEQAFEHYQLLLQQLSDPTLKERLLTEFKALIKDYPDQTPASYAILTQNAISNQQYQKALNLSRSGLRQTGFHDMLAILQVEALLSNGEVAQAKKSLKQFQKAQPDTWSLFIYEAEIEAFLFNEPEKAKAIIEQLSTQPLSDEQQLQLTYLSMHHHWYKLATPLLKDLVDNPTFEDSAHYFLGQIAEQEGRIQQAVRFYQRVDAGEFHIAAYTYATSLLMQTHQNQQALSIIDQAVPSTYEELKLILLLKAQNLLALQQPSEALKTIETGLKYFAQDTDLRYAHALSAMNANQPAMAEADLQQILSLQPNHVEANNLLGYVLLNFTQRYDEALAHIQKAHELAPKDPNIWDSLGWAYYRLEQSDKAIQWLTKAWETTGDPDIAAHLGEVLWMAKHQDQAEKVWSAAFNQSKGSPLLEATLNRFLPHYAEKPVDPQP